MNRMAIFHRTYSEYSFATAKDRVVVRLRAARADLDECYICYGDRMDPNSPINITRELMDLRYKDDLFDYYEAIFDPKVTRLCYYFELKKGDERIYYYNDGFFAKPHENRQLYYNFHYIREEDIAMVPDWFKKAIVYQIYPDSFASSKRYILGEKRDVELDGQIYSSIHGGTIKGIHENLDYLENLGINCIYLTPIFAADSWHKYDTTDYFEIDPCFGSKEDFKSLVDECHRKGIRVIIDGVFNHSGPNFFAFKDLCAKGADSKYLTWFYPYDLPIKMEYKPNYECFAYVSSMPKLNTGNLEVSKYLIDVGTYWIKEFDVDGWRLDVANEIDHDFWRNFRKAVHKIKPDVVLIGEIWDDARAFLMGDQFDSAMNYNLTFATIDAIARHSLKPEEFANRLSYLLMRYKEQVQQAQLNLLDSHDIPRFLSQADGDRNKLKQAACFLLTHVGVPMIFYGDEQGLAGWSEIEYRRPMEWKKEDDELFNFYKKLISFRKKHIEAINNRYEIVYVDDKTLVFACSKEGEGFVVLLNLSDNNQKIEVQIPDRIRGILKNPVDYFTSRPYEACDTSIITELEPNGVAVIETK